MTRAGSLKTLTLKKPRQEPFFEWKAIERNCVCQNEGGTSVLSKMTYQRGAGFPGQAI